MSYFLNTDEIVQTIRMIEQEHLDVRTITLGLSLLDCATGDIKRTADKVYEKICREAHDLVPMGEAIEREFGIPIVNKRVSVTPVALIAGGCGDDLVPIAEAMDRAAREVGVNYIGGFSALVQKGFTTGDRSLIASIPEALARTELVCSSVNVGSTRAGINMDAVAQMGRVIKETAHLTRDRDGLGCAKLVVFCNAVEDNPFMAGAFHGVGEADTVINVGVSGPGVVYHALQGCKGQPFDVVAETIKKTAFQITRMGQMVAAEASARLGVPFGIVDLSLAPTPAVGDSVARILETMGLEVCGTHGTTAALALLNDAVKKGGNRQELHEKLRVHSQAAARVVKEEGGKNDLIDRICADPAFMITHEEVEAILRPEQFTGRSCEQVEEYLRDVIRPLLAENADLLGEKQELSV